MINNEQEKRAAVKAVKALNQVLSLDIVENSSLYRRRTEDIRNDIQREIGAYIARKNWRGK